MLIIGIFGAPGSGKGTQGKLISETYSLYPISIGEMLRNEIKNKTKLGLEIEEYVSQGKLLPDEFITKIFYDIFQKSENKEGYIFDGFPRTITQAKALDEMLMEQNISVDILFSLVVNEKELINRLLKRSRLVEREDDNIQIIKNRLLIYKNQTEPVQNYYEKQKKLIKIPGENSVEKIFGIIRKKINFFLD